MTRYRVFDTARGTLCDSLDFARCLAAIHNNRTGNIVAIEAAPARRAKRSCAKHARSHVATCGNCHRAWCNACDPALSALCPWCNGRGHSTAPLTKGY